MRFHLISDNTDTQMGMPPVTCANKELQDFVNNIQIPCNAQKGDKLPVSTFVDRADGTFPQGSAAFEKRGIAVKVPSWDASKCIQCICSFLKAHASTVDHAHNRSTHLQSHIIDTGNLFCVHLTDRTA